MKVNSMKNNELINMNKKIIFVLSILILFLMMITFASASDVNTTDDMVASTTENPMVEKISVEDSSGSSVDEVLGAEDNNSTESLSQSDDDLLSASADVTTFSLLNAAFRDSSISEINIKNDITFTSTLTLSRNNVVINGNGHTLNGNNLQMLIISGRSVTLKNIIFTKAKISADNTGSAVHMTGDYGQIINCTFYRNTATIAYAAAVYVMANNVNIKNCNFTLNSGCRGAALYLGNNYNYINVTNCIFDKNTCVGECAAAIAMQSSNSIVSSCNFTDNSADFGGAVLVSVSSTNNKITSSKFIGNKATVSSSSGGLYGGGAIFGNSNKYLVNYCTFINNTAVNGGGSIHANVEGMVLNYNLFIDISGERKNGIHVSGKPDVNYNWWGSNDGPDSSAFANPNWLPNIWYVYNVNPKIFSKVGGGNYVAVLEQSFMEYNKVSRTYSEISNPLMVIDRPVSVVSLTNGEFFGTNSIGNLYWKGTQSGFTVTLKVDSTTITVDVGDTSVEPESLYTFLILQCLIEEYYKNTTDTLLLTHDYVYDETYDSSLVDGIVFSKGILNGNGYSINGDFKARILTVGGNDVIINNVNFINGNATLGGAIYSSYDSLSINNCNFSNNNANNGGALYLTSKSTLNNLLFNENTATSQGGGIYLANSSSFTIIKNCNFTKNEGSGSAINIYAGNVTIDNCIFSNNKGTSYGAIDSNTAQASDLTIKNSKFYNNTANIAGAICFTGSGSNMNGYNLTFIGNSAIENGGACSLHSLNSGIYNSTFINNSATRGGAIRILKSNFTIDNCKFTNNNATDGGAVYITVDCNIYNSKFTNNTAVLGGAIYNNGILNLSYSNFTNNSANKGGAIYSNSNLYVNNSNFISNSANYGGALYLIGQNNVLFKSTFINNRATTSGSSIYVEESKSISLDSLSFEDHNNNILGVVYLEDKVTVTNYNNINFDIENPSILRIYAAGDVYSSRLYVSELGLTETNSERGSGLMETEPISITRALKNIIPNGEIVFLRGDNYLIAFLSISKNVTLIGNASTIKRSGSSVKFLFVLQDGVVLNISDMTLTAGIDVVSGSELNLDNITFTGTSANDGGIIYEAGSSGCIINSNFTGVTSLMDSHIVTVNGNVDVNNTEFSSNSLTGSALYYSSTGTGSISNSVFTDNEASGDVRNINIVDISKVTLSANTFDVDVDYTITNSTYGSLAYIQGTFDTGVNFDINNINLIINDTGKTNITVTISPTTYAFNFDVSGKLAVGKYNLTISNNDGNKYNVNYLSNNFEVTKASITINPISDITVSYGDNDTIVITGSVTNNMGYGKNYTGIVSVIIADNNVVNATVSENGIFTVNVNVKAFNKGVYALNVTILGNGNFTGVSKKFDSYLTVKNATIAITSIENITVDYGVDYVIVNGTLKHYC